MKTLLTGLLILLGGHCFAQTAVLPKEVQIKMATQVLPEEEQTGAMVYGYNENGEQVVLRKGSNHLVCLADDPNKKGVSISCYSIKLEPFMARGRQLIAEGRGAEVRDLRKKEVEAGTLKMPDAPSMTYILSGEDANLDPKTGELKDGHLRYVVYIPYATTESTGLPDRPLVPGMPWLMDPGTHRAHIMITPPRK